MSWDDSVVYHIVVPRAPAENGRSCLKGTGRVEEREAGAGGRGTGGWSGAGGLERKVKLEYIS